MTCSTMQIESHTEIEKTGISITNSRGKKYYGGVLPSTFVVLYRV